MTSNLLMYLFTYLSIYLFIYLFILFYFIFFFVISIKPNVHQYTQMTISAARLFSLIFGILDSSMNLDVMQLCLIWLRRKTPF